MTFLAPVASALFLLSAAIAEPAVQTSTDWDFTADPARNLTIASVDYSTGVSLLVMCSGKTLSVGLRGLPPSATAVRLFDREFADGRIERSWWDPSGEAIISGASIRDGRSFRRGGHLMLNAAPEGAAPVRIDLELPQTSENLDRVFEACELPLVSRFDSALPLDNLLLATPALPLPISATRRRGSFNVEVNCLVADSRLASCESERQDPVDRALGDATAQQANGVRVRVSDPAAAEGRWVQIVVSANGLR